MKISEIEVGKIYTNGKGRLRKVENIIFTTPGHFHNPIPYDIFYSIPGKIGRYGPTLAQTFAHWAKSEIKEGE